jgi:glycine hydroxymethyltransferase
VLCRCLPFSERDAGRGHGRRQAQRRLARPTLHHPAGARSADQLAVRALLSAEVGTRAEGNIGAVNRWFAGTQYIDEIEALCVELLKKVFRARYADHRLVASMLGNLTVYTALAEPGDVIMSVAQPFGGHSSNRPDGPAGVRGLKIVDVPMDPIELEVDLDLFRKMAPLVKPKLVTLGLSMTLFRFRSKP